jgi:hypothetical protein
MTGKLALTLGALLAMTAAAAADPPLPPARYAKLFNAVSGEVDAFAAAAPSCPGNSAHPLIVGEIGPADSNFLARALPPADPHRVAAMEQAAIAEAQLLRDRFGITGVETSMSYPVLVDNPANLPDNGTLSTQYYPKYLQFYEDVTAGWRALGLKVVVEANINLPDQNPGLFTYSGITLPQLQAGMTEVGQHLLDNIHPDVLEIFSEPRTLALSTGLKTLLTPPVYAQFIVGIRQAYDTSNSPNTLFSAGSEDWSKQDFFVELVDADAAAAKHLDIFDVHAYPPDDLDAAIADLDYLVQQGKTISMSETWDNKISTQAPIALPPGWTAPDLQQVLNGYSFWEGVDAAYLPAMYANLDCRGAAYVDFWHSPQFSAYVDYNATTAKYDARQMLAALNAAVQQSVADGTISATGAALRKLTGMSQ